MISIWTILLRLCVALLLGALIGLERESHAQPAGLRTNALVALGTCLFMIISAYGFLSFLGISHVQVDPSRVASYVVAGIGFLGAGTIFKSQAGDRVKGLTTAAAIWVVAAIGLACGIGFLLEAVVTTALTLTVLVVLRFVERYLGRHRFPSAQHIRIEAASGQSIGEIYDTCTRGGLTVKKIGMHTEKEGVVIELSCLVQDAATISRVIGQLYTLPGISAIHANFQANPPSHGSPPA